MTVSDQKKSSKEVILIGINARAKADLIDQAMRELSMAGPELRTGSPLFKALVEGDRKV